jgi:hypothetical protein
MWPVTGQCGLLQDNVACYRTMWPVTGQCGLLQDIVACYRTLWPVRGQCGLLQDIVACYRTMWPVTGQCGLLQDNVSCYRTLLEQKFIALLQRMLSTVNEFLSTSKTDLGHTLILVIRAIQKIIYILFLAKYWTAP